MCVLRSSFQRTVVVFLLLFHGHVEAQYEVIGSSQPVVAAPGDDAILPCRVSPPQSATRWTVGWSRSDVQIGGYVHVYRHGRDDPDMQIPSYTGRTSLFQEELSRGNISLKIANVTLKDAGTFKCFVPALAHSRVSFSVVSLVVESVRMTTAPLRTHEPTNESTVRSGLSGRSGLVAGIWFCVLLILIIAAYFTWKHTHKNCSLSRCFAQRLALTGARAPLPPGGHAGSAWGGDFTRHTRQRPPGGPRPLQHADIKHRSSPDFCSDYKST